MKIFNRGYYAGSIGCRHLIEIDLTAAEYAALDRACTDHVEPALRNEIAGLLNQLIAKGERADKAERMAAAGEIEIGRRSTE